ncbi:hypothetical protein LWI29_006901 [Acer saccharum]|uniref:Uncharacterized protein n=1 Tax=Acer saccharum TaxID=4024 RepID=A0AA39SMJ3_ACESA|nr:hypothetical protein LWI29_006901 [Acer saccharum]
MAASKMKLKLVVDTKAKKVLFAEAGKDFIDILICLPSHILMCDLFSFPVSTAVRLLKEKNMVGFLGDLYGSIENLPDAYWQTNDSKKNFLSLLLSNFESYSQKSYSCPSCHAYVADYPNLL